MKNKFILTNDLIKESERVYFIRYLKKYLLVFAILIVIQFLSVISSYLTEKTATMDLLLLGYLILMTILFVIIMHYKFKKMIKNDIDRYNILYGKKNKEIVVTMENKITNSVNGRKNTFNYSDIKKCMETKNLMLLLMTGNLIVLIKKDAFIKGDYKSFKELLKKKKEGNYEQ